MTIIVFTITEAVLTLQNTTAAVLSSIRDRPEAEYRELVKS